MIITKHYVAFTLRPVDVSIEALDRFVKARDDVFAQVDRSLTQLTPREYSRSSFHGVIAIESYSRLHAENLDAFISDLIAKQLDGEGRPVLHVEVK